MIELLVPTAGHKSNTSYELWPATAFMALTGFEPAFAEFGVRRFTDYANTSHVVLSSNLENPDIFWQYFVALAVDLYRENCLQLAKKLK